jgi:hypothetical protein
MLYHQFAIENTQMDKSDMVRRLQCSNQLLKNHLFSLGFYHIVSLQQSKIRIYGRVVMQESVMSATTSMQVFESMR